jgi:hypothetical protein
MNLWGEISEPLGEIREPLGEIGEPLGEIRGRKRRKYLKI